MKLLLLVMKKRLTMYVIVNLKFEQWKIVDCSCGFGEKGKREGPSFAYDNEIEYQ